MKFLAFACVFLIFCVSPGLLWGEDGNYEEVLKVATNFLASAQTYTIPKDNSAMLKLNTTSTRKKFGTYDFIIVGAGAAGAVIANRLSEIAGWQILLLEAGGPDVDFTRIIGLSAPLAYSDLNWGYNSTTQEHGCLAMKNYACNSAHGKALGGSTTTNGMVYARGNAEDFNRWVDVFGNPGWSYDEVLPYFKKSENAVFEPRDEDYHGVGGYLTTSHGSEIPKLGPLLIRSYKELGNDYVDHNGRIQNGISQNQIMAKGNERASTAKAFLAPIKNRQNLVISERSFVTKVLINATTKTAYGVKFVKNGTRFIARARKEVILSAGGYNSAQILMLSGIGPKNKLTPHNISVIQDLPVGQKLFDHPGYFGLYIKTNNVFNNQTFEELILSYTQHLGPLTLGFGGTNIAFWNIAQNKTSRPDIEYAFSFPAPSGADLQRYFGVDDVHAAVVDTDSTRDIWFIILLMHPKSTGSVTLKSKSPVDHPLINSNILSHPDDVEVMYQGIKNILKLNGTKNFTEFGAEIRVFDAPYCNAEKFSKEWFVCAMKYWSTTIYHPVAANAMGPNPNNSVVNSRLKVHGINQLRVADESIMPEPIAGHNTAPTIMIGEKISDVIKADYGKN